MSATATPTPPSVLLAHHVKELRLPTCLREYERMAQQCAQEGVDRVRYLLRLVELELIDRERRLIERRIRAARFPTPTSLDAFDFLAIASVNNPLVMDLAHGDSIDRRKNIIALSNSGTGKSHHALGPGLAACQRGHAVLWQAVALVNVLIEARDEKHLLRYQKNPRQGPTPDHR